MRASFAVSSLPREPTPSVAVRLGPEVAAPRRGPDRDAGRVYGDPHDIVERPGWRSTCPREPRPGRLPEVGQTGAGRRGLTGTEAHHGGHRAAQRGGRSSRGSSGTSAPGVRVRRRTVPRGGARRIDRAVRPGRPGGHVAQGAGEQAADRRGQRRPVVGALRGGSGGRDWPPWRRLGGEPERRKEPSHRRARRRSRSMISSTLIAPAGLIGCRAPLTARQAVRPGATRRLPPPRASRHGRAPQRAGTSRRRRSVVDHSTGDGRDDVGHTPGHWCPAARPCARFPTMNMVNVRSFPIVKPSCL